MKESIDVQDTPAESVISAMTAGTAGKVGAVGVVGTAVATTVNVFGLAPQVWTVLFGAMTVILGISGLAVTWYYKDKEYKLKERIALRGKP